MSAHRCCNVLSGTARQDGSGAGNPDRAWRQPSLSRRLLGAAEWVVPGIVLAILPKCPLCIAAYVAVVTGIGISVSTAAHVRMLLLLLCAASLVYLTSRVACRSILRRNMSR